VSGRDARDLALDVLIRVAAGAASDRSLDRVVRRHQPPDRDRALATELVYGTLRRRQSIDRELARHSRRPLAGLDPTVLEALRLGAYQWRYLTKVPDHAVVDSVVAAVKRRQPAAAGFVNAVLRAMLRDAGSSGRREAAGGTDDRGGATHDGSSGGRAADVPAPPTSVAELADRLDVPEWWAQRWAQRYGLEAAAAWFRPTLEPAPLALRPHPRVVAPEALAGRLAAAGVDIERSSLVPGAWRVVRGNPLRAAPPDAAGYALRGEAGQLVAALLPATPADVVLDACAGRGGKAIQIAEDSGARLLAACDLAEWRARSCAAAAAAAATPAVHPLVADLTKPAPFRRRFTAVLVDAPCSGLGTIRRRPELKWRNRPERLQRLAALQGRILSTSAEALRGGGALLYATCSTEPEENEGVVEALLADAPQLERRPVVLPGGCDPRLVGDDGYFRTYPLFPELDGFFAALLVKTE
jgi:16S rRNA (cytosine967-C5)-methyltransferase